MNPTSPPERDNPPDSFTTLEGESEAETKVQRSRFVGLACHASNEEDARARIEAAARRFHDARHVCFGFQLGLGRAAVTRRNDDGEPSGTAGDPILKAIERGGLTDVLVVVVRWFGGVKLGTGGLARAYGQAAELALEGATRREVLLGRSFTLEFPYALEKTLRRLLDQHEGRITGQDYGAAVNWRVWLPHSRWQAFEGHLTESTAGRISLTPVDDPAD